MRSGTGIVAFSLLLALTAGCAHRQRAATPPPAAQAPSRPPSDMVALASPMPPALPPASDHPLKLDTTTPPEPAPPEKKPQKRLIRHRSKTAQETPPAEHPQAVAPAPPPATDTPAPAAEAASGQPSEMSPIGQLSTTNGEANTADRREIAKQIDSTETGLNGLKRPLSLEEQKTAAQIRTFISRARDALKADDLDGARTLSTKAQLLLQELINP